MAALSSPSDPNPKFLPHPPPNSESDQNETFYSDHHSYSDNSSLPDLISPSLSLPQNPNNSIMARTPTLFHLSFNQDASCFAAGTDNGFIVYNCDPFVERFRRVFDSSGGGVGVVEMLFQCNMIALVGGGSEPQFPVNKVMIWDDSLSRCTGELAFRSEVKAVRLRHDRVVVVMLQKIMVYNFKALSTIQQIETIPNPKGLCAVSNVSAPMVLACPGLRKGQIRVEHCGSKQTKFITAHNSSIACLALTQDGMLLATASSKGTLVRIFNTLDGSLLQEVRRGSDRAEIFGLAFSSNSKWLAVSSDKGTVHIFSLKVDSGSLGNDGSHSASEHNLTNPSAITSLSFMKGVLPRYFSSEWSVAQFRLPEACSQYIVAFGHQKHTVLILGMDGSFYRCKFDPVNGGEMIQLEYYNILKPGEAF